MGEGGVFKGFGLDRARRFMVASLSMGEDGFRGEEEFSSSFLVSKRFSRESLNLTLLGSFLGEDCSVGRLGMNPFLVRDSGSSVRLM